MKKLPFVLLLTALAGASCGSTHSILEKFSKKTPHEKYEEVLDDRDIDESPEGRAWVAASKSALENAQDIQLPYRQLGFFQQGKPRALGLRFHAKQGQRIRFTLDRATKGMVIYSDIFQSGTEPLNPVIAADTGATEFSFDVPSTGSFTLRLQPQLHYAGAYNLSVAVGPSLSFPVSGNKAKTGSFWGDNRDGGKRKHEGIDIFAPKLTPAVAASDGYIVGVREEGIGGKTVWLRPTGKELTLYYAHLDKQLVKEGQFVKQGDVVGLVGNTGNAKSTPPHLHFGVYTFSGAVDPFPFVNKNVQEAPSVPHKDLSGLLKVIKTHKGKLISVQANTILVPLAATPAGYLAELPDGKLVQLPFNTVKKIENSGAVAMK